MTGQELFTAIGTIDERYVHEAEYAAYAHRHTFRWTALAACLCLLLLLPRMFGQETGSVPQEGPVPECIEALEETTAALVSRETPSLILRVEEPTEEGFTATVVQLEDTSLFPVGTGLNVVLEDAAVPETAAEYVIVQFVDFDLDTNTIVVDTIEPWNGG